MPLHIVLLRGFFLVLLVAGGVLLLSAVRTKDAKPCSEVKITYAGGYQRGFIKEQDVLLLVQASLGRNPLGVGLHLFDLGDMERRLENDVWVRNAQLYFDNNQVLHIYIEEQVPVARLFDNGGFSFYITENGQELPLSTVYRANLPVFTGLPARRNTPQAAGILQRVVALAQAILADTFWMAQAAQIDVLPNGQMELIPALGHHTVDLGHADNPASQLARLKAFYKAMALHRGLDAYHRINAAFEGQIVAQTQAGAISRASQVEAMQTYQRLVTANQKAADAASVVSSKGVGRIVETGKTIRPAADKPVAKPPAKPPEPVKKEEQPVPKAELKPKAVMPKFTDN